MSFTCSICWSNFQSEDLINATNCGHVFHVHCLQQWWTASTRCPMCRSICAVRNIRVLHFSCDNATIENEFMVGVEQLLDDQDNEIAKLHKQLNEEKKKLQKSNEFVRELNGHLRMEEKKRKEDKIAWRRQNDLLKSSNSELLKKTKALEKQMKQTPSDDVKKEICGRTAAGKVKTKKHLPSTECRPAAISLTNLT